MNLNIIAVDAILRETNHEKISSREVTKRKDETSILAIWSAVREVEMEWPCLEMTWQTWKMSRLGRQ